jgi:mRNA-degrading endonuclease RelE of RelBE toxin-antitoxin system
MKFSIENALYTAKFTSAAVANIKSLPKNVRRSLRKQLESVVLKDPIGCSEELTGRLERFRSFHYLDYRIIYRVFSDMNAIAVVGVGKKNAGHYAEIYKRLEALVEAGKLADSFLEHLRSVSNS